MDREDAVESGDRQDLVDRSLGTDEGQPAIMLARALERGHEDAEPAGVHEPHVGEVDDEPALTLVDHLGDLVLELRRGVQVDLALYGEHAPAGLGPGFEYEVDRPHLPGSSSVTATV